MSAGFVPQNKSARKSDMEIFCGPVFQRGGDIQNQSTGKKISLLLDSTTSLGCEIPYSQ